MAAERCEHKNRESSTTEVRMRDGWEPSTTYIRCADCGAGLGIRTRAAAFQADHVPRRAGPWLPMSQTGSGKC